MSKTATQAFEMGASATASEVSTLFISLCLAFFFVVFAYVVIHAYGELQQSGEMKKFFFILIRMALLIVIISYFLLN
ncbi:DUF3262 family protein [Pasteurella oralis]|uniref:DUF3262 family protein n=1 Tax=Pasteurella oralis TaxID=1071947 RepID=UPI000C798665|nr:DUF3262 family protein [Pasteurella oralis]